MAFSSGGKIVFLKAKANWKKIDVPTISSDFENLIEFEELHDYEFIDKPVESTETKKKRKKKKQGKISEENETAEETFSETSAKEGAKSKKRKKKNGSEWEVTPVKKLKKDSEGEAKTESSPGKKRKNKKKNKKKKNGLKKSEVEIVGGENDFELEEKTLQDVCGHELSEERSDVASDVGQRKKKGKGKNKKKVVERETVNEDVENGTDDDENEVSMASENSDDDSDNAEDDNEDDDAEDDNEEDNDNEESEGNEKAKSSDMSLWKDFSLSPKLVRALRKAGFTEPTPIQAMTLPHAIQYRMDIIGAAQTGSGKTLAFGLPILQYILDRWEEFEKPDGPVALIMEPTRELAMQVDKHLKAAACFTKIKVMPIVGQMAVQKQQRLLLRKPHIIVATPGRLWELVQSGQQHLQNLRNVRQFVLDEADRLTEKNHFEEMSEIIGQMQAEKDEKVRRQHFIFSATLTIDHTKSQDLVKRLKKKGNQVKDAKEKLAELVADLGIQSKVKKIDLSRKEGTADTLTETGITCQATEKDLYLYYMLRKYGGRTLVFCNSKDCIRRLTSVFKLLGCNPLPLHSDMRQRQRLKNLDNFTARPTSMLLATDVAARGLDIRGVDHVVHYQVPFTVQAYIHRSGRTARASNVGLSVLLISPEEIKMYRNILKLKEGEELPAFPVDPQVIQALKAHVKLATEVDKEEHRLRRDKAHDNWMVRAAREADLELDDDLLVGQEDGQQKQQERKLKQQKLHLEAMLKQPLFPNTFSSRYPTKSGQLVVPKQFTSGNAVADCLNVKTKQKNKKQKYKMS